MENCKSLHEVYNILVQLTDCLCGTDFYHDTLALQCGNTNLTKLENQKPFKVCSSYGHTSIRTYLSGVHQLQIVHGWKNPRIEQMPGF